jgi:hypothetical protein
MRIVRLAFLVGLACLWTSSLAQAACPGLKAARLVQDRVIPDKVDVHALRGATAEQYVKQYDVVIARAQPCLSEGTPDEQAQALVTISQVRYIQSYILTHDGIASDRAPAVAIAKRSEQEINAFTASHAALSGQNRADLDNWLHFTDLMINKPAEACLGC